jgi:hypothetical protein
MYIPQFGLLGGIAPQPIGDTSAIPANIRALMAKRKLLSADTTKKFSIEDDLRALKNGTAVKLLSQREGDSLWAANRPAWVSFINEIGYDALPPKKNQ